MFKTLGFRSEGLRGSNPSRFRLQLPPSGHGWTDGVCLQNEVDIPILMTGVMVLVILLPVVPVSIEGHLQDVFDITARIAALITKKPGGRAGRGSGGTCLNVAL